MIKYRGIYRVVYEFDKSTGKSLEASFIKCRKGVNIYRHSDKILNVYIPSGTRTTYLLKMYPDLFKSFQKGDTEGTLLFDESRINEAALILGAMTKGCNVSPKSKRNNGKYRVSA